MPQIINETNALSNIGEGLGAGLLQGLQLLTHHKLDTLMKDKQRMEAAKFWKSFNIPDELAMSFASAPKELQKEMLDRLEGLGFRGATAQPENYQQIPTGQQSPYQFNQPAQSYQQPGLNDILGSLYGSNASTPQMQQQVQQQVAQQPSNVEQGLKLGISKEERRHRELLEEKKINRRSKETAALRKQIYDDKKVARQELHDADMQEELNSKGNLDTPGYVEFLDRAGLSIPALLSPDSEQFQKIQASQLRNIGTWFKGSISTNEINQYLKAIPTLSQSPEGRKRVIAMQKNIARAKLAYADALDEVMAEHKGVIPDNLQGLIEKKVEKKTDKLAKLFKQDLAKPVPAGQNRFITALQATAGSAIKPLGTAVTGAAIGSVLPGVGTVAGGLAGGIGGLGAKLAGLI